MFSRSWLKPWQMTQGHPWEFHLLLLCLYNGFFFLLWKNLRYHPHTLHFFLPSLFLFFFLLPPPSPTNALTPTQKKKTWVHAHIADIHARTGLSQPSVTDMLMTLHSNKTNDFLCQISEDQAVLLSLLLPAISSTKTRWEINDLSECQCGVGLGLIHKHKAHSQKKGTPPPSVEWWCSVDLITHMQPRLNTCSSSPRPYFLLRRTSLLCYECKWVPHDSTCKVHRW